MMSWKDRRQITKVEFLLAHMSVKLDLKFPYLIKNRIKVEKRVAEREDYQVYKADLERVCDELMEMMSCET
jgi:hypothetical protein